MRYAARSSTRPFSAFCGAPSCDIKILFPARLCLVRFRPAPLAAVKMALFSYTPAESRQKDEASTSKQVPAILSSHLLGLLAPLVGRDRDLMASVLA